MALTPGAAAQQEKNFAPKRRMEEYKKEKKTIQNNVNKAMKSQIGHFQDSKPQISFEEEEFDRIRKEDRQGKFEREYFGELGSKLDEYVKEVNKLHASIPGVSTIQTAPIIPIIKNAFLINMDLLRVARISAVYVADYIIFENQLLIGINFKKLSEANPSMEEYRQKSKIFTDKIELFKRKVSELVDASDKLEATITRISEVEASINEDTKKLSEILPFNSNEFESEDQDMALGVYNSNVNKIKKVLSQKEQYLKDLNGRKEALVENIGVYTKKHEVDYAELEKVEADFKDFKVMHKLNKDGGDFSKNLFLEVVSVVSQLNSKLSEAEQLVFPETGFNYTQMAMGLIPKEKHPQPVIFNDVAYFWVMKVRALHRWKNAMGGANLEMHGWTFPHKLKSKIQIKIEKEAHQATTFVDEILKLRKMGLPEETARKKMMVYLAKQHKHMDEYFTSTFNKVWAEADEVLETRTAKNVGIPKAKLPHNVLKASSLLLA